MTIFSVSAKFVFGNDLSVVANPSKEDQEFIDAVSTFIALVWQVIAELSLYKIYNNKLSKDFMESVKVDLG